MKNIFLDTNIVIDFLANRKPFSLAAAKIFNHSLNNKVKVFISAISYNNIYYILKRSLTHFEALNLLNELLEMTEVIDVTKLIIRDSLKSTFKDFEDAIQYNCALSINKIDSIVTRNTKDFRKSVMPILTPEEAVSFIETA